jgi:hypothetical protein
MNLLYADESGSVIDPKQIFFVLAGVSVFERQRFWISEELEKIAKRFNQGDPKSVELHGSPMLNGRGFWRKFKLPDRITAIKDCLKVLATSHNSTTIFGCVIRKSVVSPKDPVELAFEQLASRFDYFLRRSYNQGNNQRGLIIFDKSTYESTIQRLAIDFSDMGHTWGKVKTLAEVPLFLDSKTSRLIQLADLVAYAIFRHYEHNDNQFYSIIHDRLDSHGGQVHGLCEMITLKFA